MNEATHAWYADNLEETQFLIGLIPNKKIRFVLN